MMTSYASASFEASCGGILEPFDDGHVPETFKSDAAAADPSSPPTNSNDDDAKGSGFDGIPKIVRYPRHHPEINADTNNNTGSCKKEYNNASVRIYDDALPTLLVNELYRCTANADKPWGTYVPIDEAMEWRDQHCKGGNIDIDIEAMLCACHDGNYGEHDEKKQGDNADTAALAEYRHRLAVAVIALLLVELATKPKAASTSTKEPSATIPLESTPPYLLRPVSCLSSEAHGVAVWALSSTVGSEVRYHIDYAELIRYEHNVTVPPLLAGTVQCTNFCSDGNESNNNGGGMMDGGDFAVNLGGLSHYESHGYKGARSGDDRGGWTDPFNNCTDNASDKPLKTTRPHHDVKTDWVTVPYRYNRAIFHHGHLPHLSTPIKSIPPDECSSNKSRVILGLNVFGHDVGSDVSKAPEHSDAFRRRIKMYRTLLPVSKSTLSSNVCSESEGGSVSTFKKGSTGLTVEAVRKNKALGKLLVLAKRERIKQDLRDRQDKLTEQIWNILLKSSMTQDTKMENHKPVRVGELMERLGTKDKANGSESNWPSPTDVQVHLHHLINNGDGGRVSCRGGLAIVAVAPGISTLDEDGILSPLAELHVADRKS